MPKHLKSVHAAAMSRFDLLRGGSELVDLSLLSARTAIVVTQVSRGAHPSPEDQEVLVAMAGLLTDAAEAFEFFGSGTPGGAPPSGALAAQVDAAIDAVLDEPNGAVNPKALTSRLLELSERLRSAEKPWTADEAAGITGFFSALSRSVLNRTGHVGEMTAKL